LRLVDKPLLVWDGDCGFCRRWVDRCRPFTLDRVDYAPSGEVCADFPDIPARDFDRSVVLIEPGGAVSRGAEAVFRALAHAGKSRPLWAYRRVPGFARASEAAYRLVASNRSLLSRLF
jgi:predicted DCC family thiol-disulfide oxidoreductase YuxK